MFNFFKKKKIIELYSVCDGVVKSIADIDAPIFSNKIMGDGFAITPVDGKLTISSPIKGKIVSVFPSRHAISFITHEGVEGLIYMGIDTATLKGIGFEIYVREGQLVDECSTLAVIDVDFIIQSGKQTDIIVVFTNLYENKVIELTYNGTVNKGQHLGYIKL